jgi:hypothetical protein
MPLCSKISNACNRGMRKELALVGCNSRAVSRERFARASVRSYPLVSNAKATLDDRSVAPCFPGASLAARLCFFRLFGSSLLASRGLFLHRGFLGGGFLSGSRTPPCSSGKMMRKIMLARLTVRRVRFVIAIGQPVVVMTFENHLAIPLSVRVRIGLHGARVAGV